MSTADGCGEKPGSDVEISEPEIALLLALLAAIALAGRWLLRDLRVHPTNFPYPSGSHGLRLTIGASDAERQPR